MADVLPALLTLLLEGRTAALATLISRRGSAPGALGSKLLVREDGTSLGSVGGGCLEADVWQAAMDAMKSREATLLSFNLTAREAAESGLICGGSVQILVEPLESHHLPTIERMHLAREQGERGVLATILPPSGQAGTKRFMGMEEPADLDDMAVTVSQALATVGSPASDVLVVASDDGAQSVLLEFVRPPKTLLILGAGHLSREVAPLARHAGFRVIVVDDRPVFANAEAFPDASEVKVMEFEEVFDEVTVDPDTYVLIVTRGHLHDEALLERAVATPAGYVGMAGSRVKIRTVYRRLQSRGTSAERLAWVHAPVGVDIAARLPEEIAISIVAELIAVRNGAGSDRPRPPVVPPSRPTSLPSLGTRFIQP